MTWSILARDDNGRFGVAIAIRFFSVGSLCVHTRRGVGAIATQALTNPLYVPAGLDLLAQGQGAADSIAALVAGDDGREQRQLHVLPVRGRPSGTIERPAIEATIARFHALRKGMA